MLDNHVISVQGEGMDGTQSKYVSGDSVRASREALPPCDYNRTVTSKVTSSPSSRKTLPLEIFPNLFSPMVGDSTVAMLGRGCTPVLSAPVLCCPEVGSNFVLAVTAAGLIVTPGCNTSWLSALSNVIACTMGSEVGDTPALVACASACARGRGSCVAWACAVAATRAMAKMESSMPLRAACEEGGASEEVSTGVGEEVSTGGG